MLVDTRRPADVLIEELIANLGRFGPREIATKTALDVKVINAVGPEHRDATHTCSVQALIA